MSIAIGDRLPDVRLATGDGGTLALASPGGRPLLVVCVRYYG